MFTPSQTPIAPATATPPPVTDVAPVPSRPPDSPELKRTEKVRTETARIGKAKSELRATAKRRRAKLNGPRRGYGHGEAILAHWPDAYVPRRVAGYYPTDEEFDVLPLLQTLRLAEVEVGLPAVMGRGRPLVFRHWRMGATLRPGRYDIMVPDEASAVLMPDVILVPLLAFDAAGGRLGYGGGYYDRTLAAHPGAIACGVAFAEQEVEAVPMEAHDMRLDAVITPEGWRALG